MNEVPTLIINLPKVNKLYLEFHSKVVICIFNGFWTKTEDLNHGYIVAKRPLS